MVVCSRLGLSGSRSDTSLLDGAGLVSLSSCINESEITYALSCTTAMVAVVGAVFIVLVWFILLLAVVSRGDAYTVN